MPTIARRSRRRSFGGPTWPCRCTRRIEASFGRTSDLPDYAANDPSFYANIPVPAKIDYFATSLPTMLLSDDDLLFRQQTTALLLQAQALLGLGRKSKGRSLLVTVLKRDPNHGLAADLLSDDRH